MIMKKKAAVVGGGASGMMSAIQLASRGLEVHVFEQNEKLGKKLFITGKGRCNVTNACDQEELMASVRSNPKFLYSAFCGFSNRDTMAFFEKIGVPLKVERGNRVFPLSDHSSDIIRALEREMKRLDIHIHLKTRVTEILIREGKAEGVRVRHTHAQLPSGPVSTHSPGEIMDGDLFDDNVIDNVMTDVVIVATGGLSYPSTGAGGDGYRFARQAGHSVTDLFPSLVPLITKEDYIPRLAGLSLKNVQLSVARGKKIVFQDFGEMMFTHHGITGPLVLSASAVAGKMLSEGSLAAWINLKPALSSMQLDARVLREFAAAPNKQFKNVITSLFPSTLVPVMLQLSSIPENIPVHRITKEERLAFEDLILHFPLTIIGLGSFHEAVITRGGVSVKEIRPASMESKLVEGLYFVGEVLDLDAVTGGFNLQIAWSTAVAAAKAAAARALEKEDEEKDNP